MIPKLEECIQYQPRPAESEAAARGNERHKTIAQVLLGKLELGYINDIELRKDVAWVMEELNERGIKVRTVEWELGLRVDNKLVWRCTIDAAGTARDEMWIVDYKTGDQRDYTGQYAAYGKAAMAKRKENKCVVLELNIDLRKAREFSLERKDAEERTDAIYHEWLERGEGGHRINQYCDWCSRQGDCPLWRVEGKKALVALGPQAPIEPLENRIDDLKNDPVKLGEFMTAFKRLETLVYEEWKLKDAIMDHLNNQRDVPGFVRARNPSTPIVDIEKVLSLIVKEMGTMRSAEFIKVSIPKLKEAWKAFAPDRELPVEVGNLVSELYHPMVKPPPGRGASKAAIKDRKTT
jgi:hypothetical protein